MVKAQSKDWKGLMLLLSPYVYGRTASKGVQELKKQRRAWLMRRKMQITWKRGATTNKEQKLKSKITSMAWGIREGGQKGAM